MAASLPIATVCFIACHGGSADHFATYADVLTQRGYDVQIHATDAAFKKFQERGIKVTTFFSLDKLTSDAEDCLVQEIAARCSVASLVLTDVGHIFDSKIHQAFDRCPTRVPHVAYYDNPEPFVPGGYSATAAKVMQAAEGIIFANETLAIATIYSAIGKELDLTGKKRIGIGYYPVSQAEKITAKRTSDHNTMRATFFKKNGLEDRGQKVLVYFGGNNEVYFSKAFPAFLSFVAEASTGTDLRNVVLVLQQHPAAKVNNQDGQQMAAWLEAFGQRPAMPKVIISDFSSDDAQVVADAALYYQTSMGAQFVLEGIPTVQIGHEPYEDLLVRNGLAPVVTNSEGFAKIIETLEEKRRLPRRDLIVKGLGMRDDWPKALEQAIMESIS